MQHFDVIVIGAGAAGMFAAINVAETSAGTSVLILEATQRALAKVKISGGGRCNVTHACFDPAKLVSFYPRGAKELRGPFSRFQPQDTVAWFARRGVTLKTESDGRMFPVTDSSETVIRCLLDASERAGNQLRLGSSVVTVQQQAVDGSQGFVLGLKTGETLSCRALILATGSSPAGYEMAQGLGHRISPLVPSLFTFQVKDERLAGLAGVSFQNATLQLLIEGEKTKHLKQTGPLLITHWGLSGPAVLKLSAFGAHELFRTSYRATLRVNFMSDRSEDGVMKDLRSFGTQNPRKTVRAASCMGDFPGRYWERAVAAAHIGDGETFAELKKEKLFALTSQLCNATFQINGKGIFKDEFVTAGGVDLPEVDLRTMESKITPGLYFAGEILNIDGITGGFNFQNAWTTGWIAGQAIAAHVAL